MQWTGAGMNNAVNEQTVEAVNKMFRSGLVALQAGQVEAAESAFNKLLKQAPGHAGAINGLGMIAIQRGDREKARGHWLKAIQAAPDFSAPYVNLGNLDRRSAPQKAIEYYQKGIELAPNDAQAVFALASLLESVGMSDQGAALASDALVRFPKHPGLAAVCAKGLVRQGRAEEAISVMEGLALERAGRRIAQMVHYTRAEAHDKLGFAEDALKEADAGRQALESLFPDALNRASVERADLASVGAFYAGRTLPYGQEGPGEDLVFLIGFPNSGTEQLAAVLRRHPSVQLRDDGFSVEKALQTAFGSPVIPQPLSPGLVADCRQAYDRHFGKPGQGRKLRVDHMPIAAAYAGFLAEIFPAARFVRFRRDPIAACLASSMRGYELTPISSYLLRFESAADLYASVETNWTGCAETMAERTLTIEDKDRVSDPQSTLSKVMEFLGLPGTIPGEAVQAFGEDAGIPAGGEWKRYEPFLSKTALARLSR